jgi:hypothetical protein
LEISIGFARKDIAGITSLSFRLPTHRLEDPRRWTEQRHEMASAIAASRIFLVLLSMIVFSASLAFSTPLHALIGLFEEKWSDGSASCFLLFLGGITARRKFIGHGVKTE